MDTLGPMQALLLSPSTGLRGGIERLTDAVQRACAPGSTRVDLLTHPRAGLLPTRRDMSRFAARAVVAGARRRWDWVICTHIDKIAEITEGFEHIALGTDFDGFIKPTMGGLEDMADLKQLEDALKRHYKGAADLIACENAIRVLRRLWPKEGAS